MEEFFKQVYEKMDDKQRGALLATINLAAELSVQEFAAYVGLLPMTGSTFNTIARICIVQKNYDALFRLIHEHWSMGRLFLDELAALHREDPESQG